MKNKYRIYLLIFTIVCFTSLSLAQNLQPYILKDINPGIQNSWGMITPNTIVLGNRLIFTADDGVHGEELWITDGTHQGTELLKDIFPGPASSWPLQTEEYLVLNGKLFFTASDGINGNELWITDGTTGGTYMVKNINASPNDTHVSIFKGYNGLMYFNADNSYWVTDGTESGTQMVKDIRVIPDQIEFNNKLYFGASDGSGYKLWASDGTEVGTQMIKDINMSNNNGFIEYNQKLYFGADDGIHGFELWTTDGTEAGTEIVKDIYTGNNHSDVRGFTIFDNKLFFVANNGVQGHELWVTDGTQAGTVLVKDINPGPSDAFLIYDYELFEYNGKLYFRADNGVHGRELWVTDGTQSGTQLLKDIYLGSTGSNPEGFYNYNGKLLFGANDGIHGYELWSTDGTVTGTTLVKDINPGPDNGSFFYGRIECNGKIYFGGYNPQFGYNLWETDGTEVGTIILRPNNSTVYSPLIDSFNPLGIVFQDELYFMAMYDDATGIEPYKLTTQPLSIDTPQSTNFAFYPNPTESKLFITADVPVEKAVVYNLQGQLLITQPFQNTLHQPATIDFSGMGAGVYFVKISGNGWEETHKIIKK